MNIINSEIKKHDIETQISELLFLDKSLDLSIEWGMNHILFAPSKRIRPLLVLESNMVFDPIDDDSYVLAAAVELVHTYSLVHDDLPCMDNDELRRGVKTLHTYKGEAFGVLAGDALLTRVFDILSKYIKVEKLPAILRLFGEKSGYTGMIKGQILDMEAEDQKLSIENINIINYYKTANLIQLAMMAGAINGGASATDLVVIEELGKYIGFIFQIQDDILDIIGDSAVLGKQTGSDDRNNKSSIPLVAGLDKAKELIAEYKEISVNLIDKLPGNNNFFRELINFLVTREK
ncbi:MAG: hypothetical protein A2015_11665 [Spirochaetes bacterium GWF1_31_7]|nr:MAG: hypothetical protein A2Y30_15410 [Spirochaetes bacterium GWE1_32_154]OHD49077.1 MAG: hypothetical protein A2015_11665 [Spirochaetes bacterium GWF1_31_7]OHD50338.1 MAG: hypothetical protein A2Y29_13460 [Spirochaetes bacterium GWE2_31_10]OHD77473.1 MAG: hypothetical protein A2355_08495 [Spirochaetes bacterium RIFOXYB1_FULL_32_8]